MKAVACPDMSHHLSCPWKPKSLWSSHKKPAAAQDATGLFTLIYLHPRPGAPSDDQSVTNQSFFIQNNLCIFSKYVK